MHARHTCQALPFGCQNRGSLFPARQVAFGSGGQRCKPSAQSTANENFLPFLRKSCRHGNTLRHSGARQKSLDATRHVCNTTNHTFRARRPLLER